MRTVALVEYSILQWREPFDGGTVRDVLSVSAGGSIL